MEQEQRQCQNGPMSRCQTSISHPTRFSFCKISQRVSAKTNLWLYSLSCVSLVISSLIPCYWVWPQSTCSLTHFFPQHFIRYPNLYEVRLIPTKKDIAFVEYVDETSATAAKDALHNYKLDGENKIKVSCRPLSYRSASNRNRPCRSRSQGSSVPALWYIFLGSCIFDLNRRLYYNILFFRIVLLCFHVSFYYCLCY